ncbi:organic cation transporter protein-like [Patiria miniata]|uniref:Major facilitator superfamily (MFS) profile domain-containing protein n=1 Tax=Patiria miniata TaxID=46514 RepID=A0A913ZIX5_PATMI|nr:organic cation transporter protein-like [Patiria miniata]
MANINFLDETLNYLGRYGRYQVTCALIIMTVGNWFPAWHLMGIIFTADRPVDYRCTTGLESSGPGGNNSIISKQGIVGTVAPTYGLWSGENATGNSLNLTDDECTVDRTDDPCTEWQYRTQYGETTIVTDLNLVCERSLLPETAQSVFLVGMLVGSLLFGFLSDTFGRKRVLLSACLAHGVCGIVAAFVWNYPGFVTLWFLIGMFSQAYNQVQFVIVMELFPPECRTLMGSLNNMFWGLGVITLTPIAYLLKDWRHMQLAISVPCLVAIPLWFVLDDSVRWLLAKGRQDEALQILNKMARWNRTAPPTGGFVLSQEDEQGVVLDKDRDGETSEVAASQPTEPEEKKSCTYFDVLKSRRLLLNTIVIYFCWFVSMMTYYGASLNSSHLAGNKYANFFFLGLAEIPAFFIIHFAMTWWGRRPSMGLFFLISGLASIVTAFLPKQTDAGADLTVAIVVMAILAKLCITCAFSINLIFCSEIFPTPVRSIGFGIGAVIANIGTVIAPFVLYLGDFASFLPLTIFGGLSLAASVLVPRLARDQGQTPARNCR